MGLLKEIYNEAYSAKQHSNLLIGDDSRVKFWVDAWCSEEPFSELFPMLYAQARSKQASVKETWRPEGKQGEWIFGLKGILMIGKWRGLVLINLIKDRNINPWKRTKGCGSCQKTAFSLFNQAMIFWRGGERKSFSLKSCFGIIGFPEGGFLCLESLVG